MRTEFLDLGLSNPSRILDIFEAVFTMKKSKSQEHMITFLFTAPLVDTLQTGIFGSHQTLNST